MRNLEPYSLWRVLHAQDVPAYIRAFILSDVAETHRDLVDFIADCTDADHLYIVVIALTNAGLLSNHTRLAVGKLWFGFRNYTGDLLANGDMENDKYNALCDAAAATCITAMQEVLFEQLTD